MKIICESSVCNALSDQLVAEMPIHAFDVILGIIVQHLGDNLLLVPK